MIDSKRHKSVEKGFLFFFDSSFLSAAHIVLLTDDPKHKFVFYINKTKHFAHMPSKNVETPDWNWFSF